MVMNVGHLMHPIPCGSQIFQNGNSSLGQVRGHPKNLQTLVLVPEKPKNIGQSWLLIHHPPKNSAFQVGRYRKIPNRHPPNRHKHPTNFTSHQAAGAQSLPQSSPRSGFKKTWWYPHGHLILGDNNHMDSKEVEYSLSQAELYHLYIYAFIQFCWACSWDP